MFLGCSIDRLACQYILVIIDKAFAMIGCNNRDYLALVVVDKRGFTANAIDSLGKLLIGIVSVGYCLISNSALGHVAVSIIGGCYGGSVCHRCSYLFSIGMFAAVSVDFCYC